MQNVKHISVTPETHKRLMALAKKQNRSMRATLEILLTEAEKKVDAK